MNNDKPFWETKSLDELNDEEWESLCDGCGRCCLIKLKDVVSNEIHYTNVACKLLNTATVRCSDYVHRQQRVPECMALKPPLNADMLDVLPPSCAYKCVANSEGLAWWHPLVSGDPDTVRQAGISVSGCVILETEVDVDDLEDYVININA
ncbi:MAG: YcgN family cysteine cluster protein [Arenicellales bacterium WSBS_2016_MAG_OTU3]